MLCRTILGKSPLVSTSFANLTIDESLEAVPIPTDYVKFFPIQLKLPPEIYRGCFSIWMSRTVERRRLSKQSDHFVLRPNIIAHPCSDGWRHAGVTLTAL